VVAAFNEEGVEVRSVFLDGLGERSDIVDEFRGQIQLLAGKGGGCHDSAGGEPADRR